MVNREVSPENMKALLNRLETENERLQGVVDAMAADSRRREDRLMDLEIQNAALADQAFKDRQTSEYYRKALENIAHPESARDWAWHFATNALNRK